MATLKECLSTLSNNQTLLELLRETAATMPREQSWYFIGGCIYQTVWNFACGRPADAGLGDHDVVYFDRRSGVEEQKEYESRIGTTAQVRVEVKNQALITDDWYERAFGRPKDTGE